MPHAIFGHAIALPPGFEDRSIYVFELDGGAPAASTATAAAAALGSLRPGMSGPQAATFSPNMVVTREKTALPLPQYVAEQRKLLQERAPTLKLVREAPYKVAGQAAHQAELEVGLPEPKLQLVQWQVIALRNDYAYCFFATTTRARWDADRPRFEAFIAAWK